MYWGGYVYYNSIGEQKSLPKVLSEENFILCILRFSCLLMVKLVFVFRKSSLPAHNIFPRIRYDKAYL